MGLEYEQNDGWLREGDFTQRLAKLRPDLSLTPEISWADVLQYDNCSERIRLNGVYRSEIESGNEIFLVYNQNWG